MILGDGAFPDAIYDDEYFSSNKIFLYSDPPDLHFAYKYSILLIETICTA